MQKSSQAAAEAAQAAKASADAATQAVNTSMVTERAIVLIDSVTLNTDKLRYESVVLFTLKNFGRTIAHSVELTGMLHGPGQWPLDKMPSNTIAPQGTNTWVTRSIGNWIDDGLIQKINVRASTLQYKIDVTYMDAFQKAHRYHCEGRYEPALTKFIITSSTSD